MSVYMSVCNTFNPLPSISNVHSFPKSSTIINLLLLSPSQVKSKHKTKSGEPEPSPGVFGSFEPEPEPVRVGRFLNPARR